MQEIWNFVLQISSVHADAEQLFFYPQVTDFKNKEVTANPKPYTFPKHQFTQTLTPKLLPSL